MCHVVCIQVSVIRANWTPLHENLHEVFNLFWLFENAICAFAMCCTEGLTSQERLAVVDARVILPSHCKLKLYARNPHHKVVFLLCHKQNICRIPLPFGYNATFDTDSDIDRLEEAEHRLAKDRTLQL